MTAIFEHKMIQTIDHSPQFKDSTTRLSSTLIKMNPKVETSSKTICILHVLLLFEFLNPGETSTAPKVVLYSGESGTRKAFTSTAQNYPDLSIVNFDNLAQTTCMLGTWIFYGSKNYANFSEGVAAYFSKSNDCFTLQKNLSEAVSSIRFAGSGTDFKQDFIDLFSGIFFTKVHLRTNLAVANLSAVGLPATTSIIVSGTSPWTLYSNDSFTGNWSCVFPKPGQLPGFYRNTLDIGEVLPRSVKKGCSQAKATKGITDMAKNGKNTTALQNLGCTDPKKYEAIAALKSTLRARADPTSASWPIRYQAHLKAVENAKSSIDNCSPMVFNRPYFGVDRYNRRLVKFQRIEEDNARLLKKIADIYINKGIIDNSPPFRARINHNIERRDKLLKLMCENLRLYEKIKNVKPTMSTKALLRWYAQMEEMLGNMSLYPLYFKPHQPCSPFVLKVLQNAIENPVGYAYFILHTLNPEEKCKMLIELFAKQAPFTAANFEKLVQVKQECGRSYQCKKFEKLVSISRRGSGPREPQYWRAASSTTVFPQFAKYMVEEDSKLKHDTAWLLTRPKQIATGEFYITRGPALYLDKLCTVFGRIGSDGQRFLEEMQKKNVDTLGFPVSPIFIAECGLVNVVDSLDDLPNNENDENNEIDEYEG